MQAIRDDHQLLLQAQQGDQKAFAEIFTKYAPDLLHLAVKRLHSTEEARDIVQEVFISFYRNLSTIQLTETLAGYFYVALRNRIFNYYGQTRPRLSQLLDNSPKQVESHELIYSALRTREMQSVIAATVNQMPPRMREIYQLSREKHFSVAEITGLLHLSGQTVKNQLVRALHRIRTQLKAHHLLVILLFKSFS